MQIQSVFRGALNDNYQDDVWSIMSQRDWGYYHYWSTSWAAATSHCLSHTKSSSPRPKNSDTYTWQFITQRHGQRAQLNRLQLDWMMTAFAEMLNTLRGSVLKKTKKTYSVFNSWICKLSHCAKTKSYRYYLYIVKWDNQAFHLTAMKVSQSSLWPASPTISSFQSAH